jgi:hypothetical protein
MTILKETMFVGWETNKCMKWKHDREIVSVCRSKFFVSEVKLMNSHGIVMRGMDTKMYLGI